MKQVSKLLITNFFSYSNNRILRVLSSLNKKIGLRGLWFVYFNVICDYVRLILLLKQKMRRTDNYISFHY